MAMAILCSVTVSIAAVTMGALMIMERENREERSTSRGKTSEYEGTKRTSSKVRPSKIILSERNDMSFSFFNLK
jgi:hypothetical protein